jgi:hypothetical protein
LFEIKRISLNKPEELFFIFSPFFFLVPKMQKLNELLSSPAAVAPSSSVTMEAWPCSKAR